MAGSEPHSSPARHERATSLYKKAPSEDHLLHEVLKASLSSDLWPIKVWLLNLEPCPLKRNGTWGVMEE